MDMRKSIRQSGGKPCWALLVRAGAGYVLAADRLDSSEAERTAGTDGGGRDIILTVSSEDLPERIAALNRALGA